MRTRTIDNDKTIQSLVEAGDKMAALLFGMINLQADFPSNIYEEAIVNWERVRNDTEE